LLVAPVYDTGDRRRVYLPPGEWVDYWTKQRHHGPAHPMVDAPLDRLPLFVRSGAVIPMMAEQARIPEGTVDPMIVEIYPGAEVRYAFREDEGVTEFSGGLDAQQFTFGWRGGPPRAYHLRIVGGRPVSRVMLDTPEGVRTPLEHWQVTTDSTLEVYVPRTSDAHVIIELADA
ncbi:MAG: hypothetical protein JNM70_23205, partial [Anaerolineae bacterium]|nr:hypothetical protein [Anaerolineae bacterium]